jgi:hypothetical protein
VVQRAEVPGEEEGGGVEADAVGNLEPVIWASRDWQSPRARIMNNAGELYSARPIPPAYSL